MLAMADRNGCVYASLPGLADRSRVTLEECEQALACFSGPDKYSRTRANEGRRIAEIEGGWLLLNFAKFRDQRSADDRREYKREWEREKRPGRPSLKRRKAEKEAAESGSELLRNGEKEGLTRQQTRQTRPVPAPQIQRQIHTTNALESPVTPRARAHDAEKALFNQIARGVSSIGFSGVTADNPDVQALVFEGATAGMFFSVAQEMVGKGKPWGYVVGTIRGRLRDARINGKAPARPYSGGSPEQPREPAPQANAAFLRHLEALGSMSEKHRFEQAAGIGRQDSSSSDADPTSDVKEA